MSKKIRNELKINPFTYTTAVSIEMSNICNYSNCHERCPLFHVKEKKILSLIAIEKILIELGKYDFSGIIYPFNYSEPLIDPRFYVVLDLIKKHVPKAYVSFYTNGFFFDETILEELIDRGVKRIDISYYDKNEEARLRPILNRARERKEDRIILRGYRRYPCNVYMNDKVDWYDNEPINLNLKCSAPINYIVINADGNVTLCCHDWKSMHTFGSIHVKSLFKIVNSEKMIETFLKLLEGKRSEVFLCSKCTKHR